MMGNPIKFTVSPMQRALLLLFVTVLCYIVASVVVMVLMRNGATATRVCLSTVFQDVLVFILPALVTALMITRRPADFLGISAVPRAAQFLLAVATLIASIPAMNCIIEWNASISLPASLEGLGEWMRQMEDSAQKTVGLMVDGRSVMSLVMLVLVVGVFAGFSEELFFRGTVQRLMITSNVNPHVAIWVTAILFSAVHFQFFGFVPRLLLGALFGYLAYWGGTVWIAVVAHVFNNTLAALSMWLRSGNADSPMADLESLGTDGGWAMVMVSVVVSVFCLKLYEKLSAKKTA